MSRKITQDTVTSSPIWETLEPYVRAQAQRFIQQVLEEEMAELLGRERSERRAPEEPVVYRNGHGKPRKLALLNGTITLKRPRVRGLEERFESRVLPLYHRQSKEVNAMLPELYLHGLASGDFELALRGLLGDGAALSATSMIRAKAAWQAEYESWRQRDLSELDVVYAWADGLYVKAGLEAGKAALLVVIVATSDGQKHVVAVDSGERESIESWSRVLRDLKARGLRAPRLWVADGHLGIWGALTSIYPQCAEQRCWNHKFLNVLDQVPLKKQAAIRAWLRKIMYAETREEAERLRKQCVAQYRKLFPKAMECLERDWDRLVTYYDFPAEHWKHLRTTNIIESPFAAVRLRTTAAKRFKRVDNACALIWKLLQVAEKTFRRLNAPWLLKDVANGVKYVNGVAVHSKRKVA
jgi:transposase-like protein